MTSKLEKEFFKYYDIKEKELSYPDNFTCYPEITDKCILELIVLLSSKTTILKAVQISVDNVKELKECLLKELVYLLKDSYISEKCKNNLKKQVQKIIKKYSE